MNRSPSLRFFIRMAVAVAMSLVALFALRPAAAQEIHNAQPSNRLIAVGWDLFSDTAWIRDHLAEMERQPFDGIVINVVGRRDDGKDCPLRMAFSKEPWKYEWFQGAVQDLKACRFKRFTDNFAIVWANPGDVDWFDDAGWRQIVEHWRMAARLAKESGLKGIAFDPEPYHKPYAPFKFDAQAGREQRSFDDYAAKVRQRGREAMQAVAGEYPDLTLFSFFLNSPCSAAAGKADPRPVLAKQGYGLLPAFVDGFLDAAPPGLTLIDGFEGAYTYNTDKAFLDAADRIRVACRQLVSPENRAKYRTQVKVGFGIYLDAYVNPPASRWRVDSKGGTAAGRLRANVEAAFKAGDGLVWIYGEKHRWWPTPNSGVGKTSWPEALPGADEALRQACGTK